MIKIADLLSPGRIGCNVDASSKKRGLELISALVSDEVETLDSGVIFSKLIGRERLGSTGLGKGVALPHARVEGTDVALGAIMTLNRGIDFDAYDHQPVDLLFALIVPEHFTEEHLQILARLAGMFSNAALCTAIRAAEEPGQIERLLIDWEEGESH